MKFHTLYRKIIEHNLTILMFVIVLSITMRPSVSSAVASLASNLAKCVGYSLSGQNKSASSLAKVNCAAVQSRLAGTVDKGFYLLKTYITHYTMNNQNGSVQGIFIHQDKFKRQIFNSFSLDFTGINSAKVIDVSIQSVNNFKPTIKTYIVPSEKVSLKDLQQMEFTQALELANQQASKLGANIEPDIQPVKYLIVAFQMDKDTIGNRLKLEMSHKPGFINGMQIGKMINKNGWLLAAATTRIALNSGDEIFFNVIKEQEDNNLPHIAGVYSNYSLEKRIQLKLFQLGYKPDPVNENAGEKTSQAIKAFQHDTGLYADGKINSSLLRLLMSPDLHQVPLLIQQSLDYLGYAVGTIDSILGSKTRQAIRSFQRNSGMSENGRIDAALFCKVSDAAIQTSLFKGNLGLATVKPSAVAVQKENRFEDRMWKNQAVQ